MAPKKAAQKKSNFKVDFINTLPSDLSSSAGPSSLSAANIRTAYGLVPRASSSNTLVCPNKWMGALPEPEEKTPMPNPKAKEVETIVVDTTEDEISEEEPPQRMGRSANKKGMEPTKFYGSKNGKGKGKAKETDDKEKKCTESSCSGNPRCLNWLGQDKWEDEEKAFAAFCKVVNMKSDPSNPRDPDLPVGLTNLGATCYANSLLQTWYQDARFRAGVYACRPPDNGNVEDSPVYQLQVLFTFLQSSIQATYNPKPLIEALKLDDQVQQDATEFSKLFLNVVDGAFKELGKRAEEEGTGSENGPGGVANLITDLFEGKETNGTMCLKCKKKSAVAEVFRELSVQLKANCKLEDMIELSMHDELLSGANQYECSHCNSKQDAKRYRQINQLPPVLHLALNRFSYDFNKDVRVKCLHSITYPLKLNMGGYLKKPDGMKEEVWYDLRGVLMHKGTSAHHGHYVAQVYDISKKKWFLMNDDDISAIDDLNTPNAPDHEKGKKESDPPKKKNKSGYVRDANGEISPRSKDAYMLIYTRREPGSVDAGEAVVEPLPPPLAQMRVGELDEEHGKSVEAYEAEARVVKAEFEKELAAKRSVYRSWDIIDLDEEDAWVMDKSSLKTWIQQGLIAPSDKKKGKATEDQSEKASASENEKFGSEVLQPDGLQPPTPGRAEDNKASMDVDIVGETPQPEGSNMPSVASPLEDNASAATSGSGTRSPTLQAPELPSDGNDQSSLHIISNIGILCEHGRVDPRKADQIKVLNQLSVVALVELGVEIEPKLTVQESLCAECCWSIAFQNVYAQEHREHVAKFEDCDESDTGAWISNAWLNDWKREIPKLVRDAGTSDDLHPGSPSYHEQVICPHDGLTPQRKQRVLISDERTAVLQSIYPAWTPVLSTTVDICQICSEDIEVRDKEQSNLKMIASKEKTLFGTLLQQQQTNKLTMGPLLTAQYSLVVPRTWARKWCAFVSGKGKTPLVRPEAINNEEFLCLHGRSTLDVDDEEALDRLICTVNETEWRSIQESYLGGPPIKICKGINHKIVTVPASCVQCVQAERQNFSTTSIKITMLTDADINADGTRKQDDASESPNESRAGNPFEKKLLNGDAFSTTRTSGRIRDKPKHKIKRPSKSLELKKGDTVKDVKMRIQEQLGIPTIYQTCFVNNRRLDNGEDKIEDVGLHTGAVLELYEFDGDDGNLDLSKLTEDVVPTHSSDKKARDEGFGGTGLFGWTGQNGDANTLAASVASAGSANLKTNGLKRKSPSSPPHVEKSAKKPPHFVNCVHCTFEALRTDGDCEICGMPQLG